MKRITALFLAILMLLSLAACGGDGDATEEEKPTGIAAQFDGSLRSLIPETDVFDLDSGVWTEKDGYGVLILEGISQDYDGPDFYAAGYHGEGSYGIEPVIAECNDFSYHDKSTDKTYYLRAIYCYPTETYAIVVGEELPMRYTCWLMAGLTEEEIGEPYFEDDVYDYIPESYTVIDLYYTDGAWSDGLYQYQVCEITRSRLDRYISILTEAGYVEAVREEPDSESMYYEARLKAYKEFDIYVTVQLAWHQEKLAIAFSEPGCEMDKEAVIEMGKTYEGTADGINPDVEPEGGYPVIDLSGAEVSQWKGYTVQTLEGVEHIESVTAFIDDLQQQGYVDYFYYAYGYYLDHITYNEARLFSLCNEATSDHVFVGYYNGKLMVIHSDDIITIPEAELCDKLGCYYEPGEYYLRYQAEQLFYGPGRGYSSDGVAYNYTGGQDAEDFKNAVQKVIQAGYTEVYINEENEFCAYRCLETLYQTYYVYAHVFLVDGHLEVQVALTYDTEVRGMD